MCGIAGFIDRSEPDASTMLGRMLALIRHRGPDGEGTLVEPDHGLAIGMRRLSIIDIEGGSQPIWNEDRSAAVVFNGEIYNYLELRRELESAGHSFRTRTDTEVIIHLYESMGPDLVSRLRGMFAFCIVDRKRRRVIIARDHFGQKPLYYTFAPDRFAFASELKCLLALPWVSREVDDDAFLDYISWLSLPAPRTHLKHVRKLPAGSVLELSLDTPGHPLIRRYWSYRLEDAPDLTDPDAAAGELDRALHDSVRVHLRADVPVGVLLSSGLDSRAVAAYAQELQDGKMQTFTVGFGEGDSEQSGAAQTAREIGSLHHELELTATDLESSIERIAWHLDEPVGDPAAFAVLKVCELARGHVKVLLSGEGSDELFAGYDERYAGMLHTMARSERLRKLAPFLPRAGVFASPSRFARFAARTHRTPAGEIVALRLEGLPGDIRLPRGLTDAQLSRLQDRVETIAASSCRMQRDTLSTLLAFDLDWQLAESLLQKADKMSMGASIELRTPLLDLNVAAIAARIPSSLKLPPGGPGKFILRKTLARKLNEPMSRPKKGFPVPLTAWLTGPLRKRIQDELFSSGSIVCGLLDRKLLRSAWEDTLANRWDGARVFYSLWLYEVWRRSFLK
ncbi:MAG: asparagine synthase (glutamine-hydrolyzing) [Chthoniobacteraceae bacterium]